MALQLTSVVVDSITKVRGIFNDVPTASTVQDAEDWTVAAVGAVQAAVTPFSVSVSANGLEVTVTVHPSLTPGKSYTVTAVNAANGGGAANPNFQTVQAPDAMAPADSKEFPYGMLRAITHGVGALAESIHGAIGTKLYKDIAPADTIVHVESTFEFDTSGSFWVDGMKFGYTSKTDGAFHGVTSDVIRWKTIGAGADVGYDIRSVAVPAQVPLSRTEQALRDTLIMKAEGASFSTLSKLYGAEMPETWPIASWRKALHSAAFGPRGTPGVTMQFVDGALDHLAVSRQATLDPAQPRRVYAAPGAAWTQPDVGRLIDLDGKRYVSVGPPDVSAVAGAYLELCPLEGPYWSAANFKGLAAPKVVTARILSFIPREPTPGHEATANDDLACKFIILFQSTVNVVPPTYLVDYALPVGDPEPVGEPTKRPVGEPWGGQVQLTELQLGDPTGVGPYPPYLTSDDVLSIVGTRLDALLAAGCDVLGKKGTL